MTMGSRLALVITMFAALIVGDTSSAQSTTASDPLRQQLERRFDVLPLRDGIALHPKTPRRGVRSIEIGGDTISIDGVPATGAELRQKLGPDADLILRVSYLDADARRALASQQPAAEEPTGGQPPPWAR